MNMEDLVMQLMEQNKALMDKLALIMMKGNNKKFSVQFEKYNETEEQFDSFLERFESYLDLQAVPLDKRGKVLISSLSGKMYSLLKNLLSPDNPSDQDYDLLKNTLRNHLNPKPLIIPSRHVFLNRKQHEGETISVYIAELRSLAIPCAYDQNMLNIMLRDVFVSGLRDRAILDRIFEQDNITLEDTLKIALAMEKALKGANEIVGKTADIKEFSAKFKGKPKSVTSKQMFDKQSSTAKNTGGKICTRCTGTDHDRNFCKFKKSICRFCKKIGHIEKACYNAKNAQSKKAKQKQLEVKNEKTVTNCVPLYSLNSCEVKNREPPIMLNVKIEGQPVAMELDTGGAVSVMSLKTFRQISNNKIQNTSLVFKTYNGEQLVPLGFATVNVEYKGQNKNLNLYIVKENLDTIFGREWLSEIKLDWSSIKSISVSQKGSLNALLNQYMEVFDGKLGEINNYEVKLELKPNVSPKFCKARVVPFALKNRVDQEIDRLEKQGIIEKVETSEWATPVVPIVKPDGSIRLCADYSVTVNPNIVTHQHPLPTIEEIFSCLSGGKHFSKIDFKHAYLQMKVDPETQRLLTINTQKGLYKCNRLMFGLNAAPAIWQRYIDGLFQGMEGCKVFMDDARVTGLDDNAHLNTLKNFFQKCKTHGLKLNLEKSKFFQDQIQFLGHKIDAKGLHKTDEKISAIAKAPRPRNVMEIQSFLGLVNFYGKFCPNLATIANPLYNLTKKNTKWVWTKDCQEAFQNIKNELCSPRVLMHYDPKLPLTLATDASPVGLGAVLSHKLPDGTERPIAYASRTLSETEKRYAQIDKEALAIVWAVQKFYLYLKGRRFTLITDHKPLVSIFGSKRGFPVLTATRMLHYALILQSFQFDIKYRNTKDHGNADFLSRLPKASEELEVKDDITMYQLSQIETMPVTCREIRQATVTDGELGSLFRDLREGKDLQGKEAHYTIQDGCIMYGQRVCIPKMYRKQVLDELHEGHLGMVKMKAIARSFVYWKGIDADIEEAAKNCTDCARFKADPAKVKVHHWEYPSAPWERIHVDFASPIFDHMFLLIVDAHSKWLEVYTMKSTTANKTIDCLRDCFGRFGLPLVLVSDNGPQFKSYEFYKFMKGNGIKHIKSAPFKPSSNGQAERYVYTLKQALRAMQNYDGSISQKLSTFLLHYRKAPNVTTTHSPAMLFLKRDIRTRIDLLLPDLKTRVQEKTRKGVYEFRDRKFSVGEYVAVRDYRSPNCKWKFGHIVNQDGELHYTVDVQGILVRRHVDQIRPVGQQVKNCWASPFKYRQAPLDTAADRDYVAQQVKKPSDPVGNNEKPMNPLEDSEKPVILVNHEDQPVVQTQTESFPCSSTHLDESAVLRRSSRVRRPPKRLDL